MRRGRASPTLWKEGRREEDRDRKGKEEERLRQRGRLCEEEAVGLGREGWKMRACRRGGKNKEWKGGEKARKGGMRGRARTRTKRTIRGGEPREPTFWGYGSLIHIPNTIHQSDTLGGVEGSGGGADRPEDNRTKRDEVWEFKLSWIEACWFT